ncbi:MAG: shikimate kinase [Bacteroidota bacterium]
MIVVLLGYMASGKSSVGKLLAHKFGYDFIDLDEEISNQMGVDIPTIFSEKGELFFRRKETEVLANVLKQNADMVLSLGGGTPCYGQNMQMVKEHTPNSFYLNLSVANLVKRISGEKEQRPLVARIPNDELPEFIGKHLFERAPFYAMASNTIFVEDKSKEQLVAEIVNYLI